jgi:undecaprenyl pyrophosphate synthase
MRIKNIGIIPDGTRRWAAREDQPLFDAYLHTFQNLREQIDFLKARGVMHIHIYMFSIFNLKRDISEVTACLDAECASILDFFKRGYHMIVHGDLNALMPVHPAIVKAASSVNTIARKDDGSPLLHLYLGYSFKHYLDRIRRSAIDLDAFIELLLRDRIDLVIRTGGAITLSDFLPIESRYAQIYFLPTLFNDFTAKNLADLCDKHERKAALFKYGE